MYDLLIKGGRVIDPGQGIDDRLDVVINENRIASLEKDIPTEQGRRVLDATDRIVSPGLIDLHCHVYPGVWDLGVEPDEAGVYQGVTTVVDGGSAGHAIFGGIPQYVVPAARTTVFCFVHLASRGLVVVPWEIRDWEEVDVEATARVIESHGPLIKGVKLRLVGRFVTDNGVRLVELAKKVAVRFGLPIMVHIGDPDGRYPTSLTSLTRKVLSMMETGDILSHVFTGKPGRTLFPDGNAVPELNEARGRGVVFDVAHGRNNFSFDVARKAMAQSILPTTISTDVVLPSLSEIVYSLTVTMSKFLALGLDLNQVLEMSTINPARAIGVQQRMGMLKEGMDADISVLEIRTGKWRLVDTEQESIEVTRLISPVMTIKAGQPFQPKPAPQLDAI